MVMQRAALLPGLPFPNLVECWKDIVGKLDLCKEGMEIWWAGGASVTPGTE